MSGIFVQYAVFKLHYGYRIEKNERVSLKMLIPFYRHKNP